MYQWLLAVTSDPAAKGSAKDLEVADAGPVHCYFPLPPSFLTTCMCACVRYDELEYIYIVMQLTCMHGLKHYQPNMLVIYSAS